MTFDKSVIQPLVSKMALMLRTGLLEYLDFIDELEGRLPAAAGRELEELKYFCSRFDTDKALRSLKDICEKLDISLEDD